MRLRATSTRLGGHTVDASFICNARIVTTDSGNALLVVHETPIPAGDRREASYEILEASGAEIHHLRQSGYRTNVFCAG